LTNGRRRVLGERGPMRKGLKIEKHTNLFVPFGGRNHSLGLFANSLYSAKNRSGVENEPQ
jgi:hypothetical protein